MLDLGKIVGWTRTEETFNQRRPALASSAWGSDSSALRVITALHNEHVCSLDHPGCPRASLPTIGRTGATMDRQSWGERTWKEKVRLDLQSTPTWSDIKGSQRQCAQGDSGLCLGPARCESCGRRGWQGCRPGRALAGVEWAQMGSGWVPTSSLVQWWGHRQQLVMAPVISDLGLF